MAANYFKVSTPAGCRDSQQVLHENQWILEIRYSDVFLKKASLKYSQKS